MKISFEISEQHVRDFFDKKTHVYKYSWQRRGWFSRRKSYERWMFISTSKSQKLKIARTWLIYRGVIYIFFGHICTRFYLNLQILPIDLDLFLITQRQDVITCLLKDGIHRVYENLLNVDYRIASSW